MPTDAQRKEEAEINRLAFELCDLWQAEQRRPVSIDEMSAFMAGVVATRRAFLRGCEVKGAKLTVGDFEPAIRAYQQL